MMNRISRYGRAFDAFCYSLSPQPSTRRMFYVVAVVLVLVAISEAKKEAQRPPSTPPAAINPRPAAYAFPSEFFIHPSALREPEGAIVIEGKTNLPNGMRIGVELYLGQARRDDLLIGADYEVMINDGQFRTLGFNGKKPYPPGEYRVHFTESFDRKIQSPEVSALIGDHGGRLRGRLFRLSDPDLTDSGKELDYTETVNVPPISGETKAIFLVKRAVLTGGGMLSEGRSSANVGATVEWYMTQPDLHKASGWTAKRRNESQTYTVSYGFIDGPQGERQAEWSADLSTGQVHFTNRAAKAFSYMPAD